jgi:hypothetical protein
MILGNYGMEAKTHSHAQALVILLVAGLDLASKVHLGPVREVEGEDGRVGQVQVLAEEEINLKE